MPNGNLKEVTFQCPSCGQDLTQVILPHGQNNHMTCSGCKIGINIDIDRLAVASEEIQKALDMVPPEITIKFFQ